MNEELDYAKMLEIPVSTVSVIKKKKPFFKAKSTKADNDEIKNQTVQAVNERLGMQALTEDFSDPTPTAAKPKQKADIPSLVLVGETVAVCALAVGIFITNAVLPNSAINTMIRDLAVTPSPEAVYSELSLSPVVSELSDADIQVSPSGVISFTAECAVYPVCNGTIAAVYNSDGVYTVEIAHTSSFVTIVSGVDAVYYGVGDVVKTSVPVARTSGDRTVSISMFNDGTLLNCYTLSGAVPVWNS